MSHSFFVLKMARTRCCLSLIVVSFLAGFSLATHASAADKSDETDFPLVVLNVASLQRLRDNAALMFDSAERGDVTTKLDQWMVDGLKETKGFDRDRPLGMMLYLNPAVIGPPVAIWYLPVTNLEEALATMAHEFGEVKPNAENQNRYRVAYGERFHTVLLYRSGYLFVAMNEEDSALDRNFPEPEKLTARLTAQYDLALSFMLKSVSSGLKTTFLTYFNSQSKARLQQRDNEPESVYRLRRANGEFWIELIDKIVNQGQELTLGGKIDREKELASIELEIAGNRDSKLAKFFQGMVGKRTYFGNLLEQPATFTVSTSILFDEKQRKLYVTFFETALKDLGKNAESGGSEKLVPLLEPLFKNLIQTSDVGHLDLIAQLTGTERGEYALVAGAKIATSRSTPDQIAELLNYLKENPNGNTLMEKLDVSFDTIETHPVHRLPIESMKKEGQRLFGDSANLYLYANPQSIWAAFGGDAGLEGLKNAVQTVSLPQDVQQSRNRVPFQFLTHARNWLSAIDDETPESMAMSERVNDSFKDDNDTMRLEIRPTDSGARMRIEFQLGYLSLLGRGISKEVDRGSKQSKKSPDEGRGDGGNGQDVPRRDRTGPDN